MDSGSGNVVESGRSEKVSTRDSMVYVPDNHEYKKESFLIPSHYKDLVRAVMIPHGLIQDRIEQLAFQLYQDHQNSMPHLLVVLKGSVDFANDVANNWRRIHSYGTHELPPFTTDYIRVQSYKGMESTGKVKITGCDLATIEGRDIMIVEDIVDTGATLRKLIPVLQEHNPRSIKVITFLEKRTTRSSGFLAEYVAFSIPDHFIIGYNLDYNQSFRDLKHLCLISDAGIEKYDDHPEFRSLNK